MLEKSFDAFHFKQMDTHFTNPQSQVTQEIDFKTTLYRKKSSQESAYVSLSFSESLHPGLDLTK